MTTLVTLEKDKIIPRMILIYTTEITTASMLYNTPCIQTICVWENVLKGCDDAWALYVPLIKITALENEFTSKVFLCTACSFIFLCIFIYVCVYEVNNFWFKFKAADGWYFLHHSMWRFQTNIQKSGHVSFILPALS